MTPSEILDHYRDGQEEFRLLRGIGRLEWLRTWELLERHLPLPPARVLDVGGGTGVYAFPLAGRGHQVDLIDAVPRHVERARQLSDASDTPLRSARIGDARELPFADGAFDAVLLLGPLYHLTDACDRLRALSEVRRVLVPDGVLVSAYISRFASLCDGIQDASLLDARFAAIVDRDLADGIHLNPANRPDWFTTAYFHRPEEIGPEVEAAGLRVQDTVAVEGPGWFSNDLDVWLDDDVARGRLLRLLRQVESEPSLLGASAHLVAIARH